MVAICSACFRKSEGVKTLRGLSPCCGSWNSLRQLPSLEKRRTVGKKHEIHERHGLNKTPEYCSWVSMKSRCYCATNNAFRYYGGRGITVCERWRLSFKAFYGDMGQKPSPKHSIDRIDNDGNYEPSNCRWATKSEQARNSRNTRHVTINGETRCLLDWARIKGISAVTLKTRMSRGWSAEQAILEPLRKSRWDKTQGRTTALQRKKQNSTWMPITDAPKDGTRFLGRIPFRDQKGRLSSYRRITQWGKASHVPLFGWTRTIGRDIENTTLWQPAEWRHLTESPAISKQDETQRIKRSKPKVTLKASVNSKVDKLDS